MAKRRCKEADINDSDSDDDIPLARFQKSMVNDINEEYVLKKSKNDALALEKVRSEHFDRLQDLLRINGYSLVKVPEDGDCVFGAVRLQLDESSCVSISQLRSLVVDHLIQYRSIYQPMTTLTEHYDTECLKLKKLGIWDTELNDIIPTSLANMAQKSVKIFTSKPLKPYIEFTPTTVIMPQLTIPAESISLAYSAIPGHEHYDTFEPIKLDFEMIQDPASTASSTDLFTDAINDELLVQVADECERSVSVEDWFASQMDDVVANEEMIMSTSFVVDDNRNTKQAQMSDIVNITLLSDYINIPQCAENNIGVSPVHETLSEFESSIADQDNVGKEDGIGQDDSQASNDGNVPLLGIQFDNNDRNTCNDNSTDVVQLNNDGLFSKTVNVCDGGDNKENDDCYRVRQKNKFALPITWKKNVRKRLRNEGKQYTGVTGKTVQARSMKPPCHDCRYKCTMHINEEERQKIFDDYWQSGSRDKQASFIINMIEEEEPSTKKVSTKNARSVVRFFHFQVEKSRFRVCKEFFLATLDISASIITTVMSKAKSGFTANDLRGKHQPGNKISDDDFDFVKQHISSFPTMKSHYSRHDSTRSYLDYSLNIKKMFRLYVTYCKEKQRQPVKEHMYRHIFNRSFNLAFHKPRKDSCLTCDRYKLGSISDEDYKRHVEKKDTARAHKNEDKQTAKENQAFHVCTFDLEQVLSTPNASTSTIYYRRKLSVYNLSVYSLGNGNGTCIIWPETEGRRGANEIGTGMYMYIQSLPPSVKQLTLYSDNCGGQHKNRFFFTALLFALQQSDHITIIDHKYLESGHTSMEVDSVHAAVESTKRNVPVYIPDDWQTICRVARKRNPYTVLPLTHGVFINFKSMAKDLRYLSRLSWKKMCWVRLMKCMTDNGKEIIDVLYKETFDGEFVQVKTFKAKTRHSLSCDEQASLVPCPAYVEQLPITSSKKSDLLALCKDGTIPLLYHSYYKDLPCSDTADRLPLPNNDESSDDET